MPGSDTRLLHQTVTNPSRTGWNGLSVQLLADGLLADEGTEFWKFCFHLPEIREPDNPAHLDFLQSADAHIMGRTAYEAISARKVVFSRTLKTADWAEITIAAGDTAEESD